jgi:DNA-binding MarR family transcriptional regulator
MTQMQRTTKSKRKKQLTPKNQPKKLRLSELSDQEIKPGSLPRATPQTRYDLQIVQALRQITRAVDLHSHRLKLTFEITAPQPVCLLAIRDVGSLTATQLSEHVHLSPSTVVGILDRLEKKELIERTRDTRDRRQVNVTLTDKGQELVKNAPSPLQDSLAAALQQLPELEQATIALSLKRIAELMEVRRSDAPLILETAQEDEDASGSAITHTQ